MNSASGSTRITALQELVPRIGAQLYENILPFWSGPAIDRDKGGWMGWLANDLTPDRAKPKGLVFHSRILLTFSAAYQARPDPVYKELAERALHYLADHFWDTEHGGAYWLVNDDGEVIDDAKNIYGQAFYIYALTECYRGFGWPCARDRAEAVFDLIEQHAHDGAHGGYFDLCRRDWAVCEVKQRGFFAHRVKSKSMNTHLHVLEAYTNLHRVSAAKGAVARRLRELIDLFQHRILDPRSNHLNHFFDEKWRLRSDTYTYGHDIEASWLLCEAAAQLGDPALLARTNQLALRLVAAVENEGLAPDGGLCHEGKAGRVIDSGREWWPQAEALVGFLNAYQLTGDDKAAEITRRLWLSIEEKFVDREHGEWFWRINSDGQPDGALPKVSQWKDPYHASRACLELLRRLA